MRYKEALSLAREMRKNPTVAERFFWRQVRNRQLAGNKFNRQFIIEYFRDDKEPYYYIVDFHCFEAKLIVEIDGKIHELQKEYDNTRTETLNQMGYEVLRFENEEVLTNWNQVETTIKKFLSKEC